jgi:hypothetical protein
VDRPTRTRAMYTHGVCTNHEAALAANQKTLARVGSVSLQL